jgi:hypothetical protein
LSGTRRASVLGLVAVLLVPVAGEAVAVRDVRIAFERERDHLFVREMLTLMPEAADSGEATALAIPLAKGARGAQLAEGSEGEGIALGGGALTVSRAVPEDGASVGVTFRLPIIDGIAAFDQSIGRPVALAHAAFLLPDDHTTLKGDGFSRAERHQTPDGLPALFAVGQSLEDGHITILITGLSGRDRWVRIIATIISGLLLLTGFLLWIRRKRGEPEPSRL